MNPDELIKLAESKGFILKNKEYYLWDIQKWLRDEYRKDLNVAEFSLPNDEINIQVKKFSTGGRVKWKKKYYVVGSDMKFRDSYEEALYYGLLSRIKYL